jgi:hypothetical protein
MYCASYKRVYRPNRVFYAEQTQVNYLTLKAELNGQLYLWLLFPGETVCRIN